MRVAAVRRVGPISSPRGPIRKTPQVERVIRVREIDKYASLRSLRNMAETKARNRGHGASWHHLDDVVHVHVVLLDVGREAVRGLLRDEQAVRFRVLRPVRSPGETA